MEVEVIIIRTLIFEPALRFLQSRVVIRHEDHAQHAGVGGGRYLSYCTDFATINYPAKVYAGHHETCFRISQLMGDVLQTSCGRLTRPPAAQLPHEPELVSPVSSFPPANLILTCRRRPAVRPVG